MATFIASFIILLLVVAAMAVGVLFSNRQIRGTCGGLNNIQGLESACEMCTKPCEERQKALQPQYTQTK